MTWVWALYFTAQLIASVIVGPMADRDLVQEIFWIAVPFSAQVAIPIYFGFFPEKQLPKAKRGVQRVTTLFLLPPPSPPSPPILTG